MVIQGIQRLQFPLVLLCLMNLFCVSSAQGQVVINVEEANYTGKIVKISPLSLTMKTALGVYDVDIVNREFRDLDPARIEVKGEKPPKFLRPRMTVRFVGQVEHGRKIRDPLTEVFVVDPAAPGGLDDEGGDVEGERPEDAEEVFVGRIRTFRLNVLSVEVPGEGRPRVLQAKLADDAVVKISFGTLAAARPGDKVQVKGWKESGVRAKRIWAKQVTVTSSVEAPDPRLARGDKPRAAGPRRAFGEIAEEPEEDAAEDDGPEYEGIILEIN